MGRKVGDHNPSFLCPEMQSFSSTGHGSTGHQYVSGVQNSLSGLRQLSRSLVTSLCGQSLVSNSRNTAVLFQPPPCTVAIL